MRKRIICVAVCTVAALFVAAAFLNAQPTPRIITTVYGDTRGLEPGDTFTVTIEIAENPGVAAMIMRIRIPYGLGLVAAESHDLYDISYGLNLPAHPSGAAPSEENPLTGDIFTGIAGRARNFYENGLMFTLTFQAMADAATGLTAPLSIAFANAAYGYEIPVDADKSSIPVELPDGTSELGASADIAIVNHAGPYVSAAAYPVTYPPQTSARLLRIANNTASFLVTVHGLPPNETFHFADLPEHQTGPGISIQWSPPLPPEIAVSGSVRTDEYGSGVGVLIFRIV